jgi:hypothetical protein
MSPKLNEKNYVDWAAKPENLLDLQGIWAIVRGENMQHSNKTPEDPAQAWQRSNGIALAILGNSVEETEFQAIRNVRNTAKAWSKLQSIHRLNDNQAYSRIMAWIMHFQIEGGTSNTSSV